MEEEGWEEESCEKDSWEEKGLEEAVARRLRCLTLELPAARWMQPRGAEEG